ncbi:MAG: DNA primase [Candidatus Woesearchaeota archaeon]
MEKQKDFQDFISELKDVNDIVDIIGGYIHLEQKGQNHWANCPFHSESTPSFAVNPEEQFYHCFGCGKSGDVIKFVQEMESLDFISAVELLAKKSGLEMPKFSNNVDSDVKRKEKEKILLANKEAARFYNYQLNTEKGEIATNYLKKRKVDTKTMTKFGLGYSPGWNALPDYLIKKRNFNSNILLKAGLIASNGDKYYDIMAERLMFPIIDSLDNVIGFSARALDDEKFAKYRNTSQNPVFDKSKAIYGINFIKRLKQNQILKNIIIVEGQMDVLSLHAFDIKNVVACMGTAVTTKHVKILKRFSKNVVLSMDGDSAGTKAAFRSIDVLEKEGVQVSVASLPEGLDPDEYIKKYGKEKYLNLVENALNSNDYKLEALKSRYNLESNNEKIDFVQDMLHEIKKIKLNSKQDIYINKLAKIVNMNPAALKKDMDNIEISRQRRNKIHEEKESEDNYKPKHKNEEIENFIIASILHKKIYSNLEDIQNLNVISDKGKKIIEFIKKNPKYKIADLYTYINSFNEDEEESFKKYLGYLIGYDFKNINRKEDEENLKEYYNSCLSWLKQQTLYKEQKDLLEKLKTVKNTDEKTQILQELSDINKQINKIRGQN